ncbi:DUF2897 family protein [Aliiglaciecola sp. LCG003]|uniref:DUF2897 family protein n=1 Tax=Aliiglaciecola sp. LCG003 TaxID=3053655 RepID=UPI0025739982|nr:DUF2897 family protein [Aliiglaciecola sp. LCG003]WJG07984.1 DUF2897 family protein [Aliiglaciecola sp. LCG003]
MNIWLIVTLLIVIGLVVGNILMLKNSANMKMEKTKLDPKLAEKVAASNQRNKEYDEKQ